MSDQFADQEQVIAGYHGLAHPAATLADLYDPDFIPPDLHRAHRALDRAVDRLYYRTGFISERERVEHLFALYEKCARRWRRR